MLQVASTLQRNLIHLKREQKTILHVVKHCLLLKHIHPQTWLFPTIPPVKRLEKLYKSFSTKQTTLSSSSIEGVQNLSTTLQNIGEREGISGLMAGWLPRLLWNGLIVGSILGLCRRSVQN